MSNDNSKLASLVKEIQGAGTGNKQALGLIKDDPQIAALVSKLVKPASAEDFNIKKDSERYSLNPQQVKTISDITLSRVRDNKNIIQIFPDIELAIQILISSIMSPKDMVNADINYTNSDQILPAELLSKLNSISKEEFEKAYDINDEMPTMLRDALFESGAYIKAIIPENSLDDIINGSSKVSMEGLSEIYDSGMNITNIGILGNNDNETKSNKKTNVAIEHIMMFNANKSFKPKVSEFDLNLEVSDNVQLLKLPKVTEVAAQQVIKSKYRTTRNVKFSAESAKEMGNERFSTLLYKGPQSGGISEFKTVHSKYNLGRKSIGRPLILRLPSESVIPVHIPGDETKHVGYFVLIDMDGNPVTYASSQDSIRGLSGFNQPNSNTNSLSSMLISKAKQNIVGGNSEPTIEHISRIYANIVEKDLIERLKNGVYGKELSVVNSEEIYRIMLARSLANKFTRLLFIPAELCTYFAFKYFDNGVGKSYLDDLKILTSLRAILLFSKVMAMAKSSISLTRVNMTLDPNDPDPAKTVELASHEIIKMRQQYFPMGINSPVDLVDWIQRAGLEFTFEGHPGLPQTKFDFESKNIQHQVPDSELDELLRKQTYMTFGLSPETVDNGFNAEFATSVVANNILLSKRVMQLQRTFTFDLSDYFHKVAINDMVIFNRFRDTLVENIGMVEKKLSDEDIERFQENKEAFIDELVERYIKSVKLELPKPDETSIADKSKAMGDFTEALEKGLDAVISNEFVTEDIAGDISSHVDALKAMWKAYFVRKWMNDNNFLTELNEIVTADEDGNATLDIYDIVKSHIEGLVRSSTKFMDSVKLIKEAANKDLNNLGISDGSGSSFGDSDSSSDSTNSSGDGLDLDDSFSLGNDDDTTDENGESSQTNEAETKKVDESSSGETGSNEE